MGIFEKLKGRPAVEPAVEAENQQRKNEEAQYASESDSNSLDLAEKNEKDIREHPDEITVDAQPGVQKAEAIALVWSKPALYATYAWIWVCFFMLALQSAVGFNTLFYAYSTFQNAPQIATANILSSIIGGVLKLPIAKLLNIWGRTEGFLFFLVVYIVGIIIMAACDGPNGYAAGYVLFYIGYSSLYFILDVFVADTSGLRNRAFAFAFVTTPFICTAFTGPLLAKAIVEGPGWRWCFGVFAIVQPVIFLPVAAIFKYYQRKAFKLGLFNKVQSNRTTIQSIIHYIHEFDAIGCLILMAAFVLFLLPFNLKNNGKANYGSATFIAMVVIGFLLFFVFAAWEKWFARVHFVRYELFRQRTVLGACLLAAILFYSFYSWDLFYYPFVEVVYDLDIAKTGYMAQIYNIGSCFWGVVFGVYIRYTKHFKYACLFFGLPLMFLGAGLMIHFRGADSHIGYIIMCQIFIAVSGGTLVIGEDMAVMAAADREGVPMMLSLISLFSSVGGAIGYAVAGAINQNTFPSILAERLPEELKGNVTDIYIGGALTQMTFPVGSPARDAINYAWGQSQMYGCISATVVLVLAIPCIAMWKNYNVDKKQNKGVMI